MNLLLNRDAHVLPQPGATQRWSRYWCAGRTGPDVWAAVDHFGRVELELSNCSVQPGQPARGPIVVSMSGDLGTDSFTLPPKRVLARRHRWSTLPVSKGWRDLYGPAEMAMARDDSTADLAGLMQAIALRTSFANEDTEDGLCPITINGQPFGPGHVGPFHPWGPWSPGAPAGSGIQHGYTREEPDFAYLAHQCAMDRAWVYYRRSDGEPLTVDDLGTRDYDGSGSNEPNGQLAEYKGVAGPDGLPAPYDNAHLIRQIRYGIACYEQTPTPMVRRHLIALAEHARMTLSDRGPLTFGSGYFAMNLPNLEATVVNGQGILGSFGGRQLGWPMWAYAMRLKLSGGSRDWPIRFLHLLERASMPSGFIQRNGEDGIDAARHGAWNDPGMDGMQTFEYSLLGHGVVACCLQLGRQIPLWLRRGAAQIDALPRPLPHFCNVAVRGGAPLEKITPFVQGGNDPAPWLFESLKGLLA